LRVRTAIPADIPGMMELERRCATAAHWTERQYQRVFHTGESDRSQRLALVIGEDGDFRSESRWQGKLSLVAFLVANHVGREWELENVTVEASFRRKGLATRLLNELLIRARSTNSESVFLEVRESNQAARALYGKWGFEQGARRRGYYTTPPEDAILYRRTLL
jgi:tRNA threonylcarbamoyladenosine biosynthesis protein TsaB